MTSEIKAPPPASVRHNDWRGVDLEPPDTFVPVLPVSVVIPYYEAPEELARTLACLEMQSYPRDLFEVVIVDDGSRIPLEPPLDTPLDVRVLRQDDRGFGLARARNNGVRAAAHGIVLFLDCDVLPESGWLEAHARWHHAVSDAVTVGLVNHVSVEGLDADTLRDRPGSLEELFSGRRVDRPVSNERILLMTDDLTSEDSDYLFSVVWGGNFGIRRDFYRLIGGSDESFTQWGGEDTELGYRAYAWGGLLVPVREALGWHQGSWSEGRDEKDRWLYLQRAKIAQLIPHREFRGSGSRRIFEVPGHAVTLESDGVPAERVLESAERVLADRAHDLVLNVRMSDGSDDFVWLERHLGADPRVRVGPSPDSLDDFPSTPFHVVLHAGSALEPDAVHRLRTELGSAASATCLLSDGSTVSIGRSWALHRARRTGRPASDFGDAAIIPASKLEPGISGITVPKQPTVVVRRGFRAKAGRVLSEARSVRSPGQAWQFLKWFGGAVRRRVFKLSGITRVTAIPVRARLPRFKYPLSVMIRRLFSRSETRPHRAGYRLGVEIAALGPRSRAVFQVSSRVAHTTDGQHLDVVVADTAAEVEAGSAPVVLLHEVSPLLSVPAFDPKVNNPIGWIRKVDDTVGALGPLELLPAGIVAHRVMDSKDLSALHEIHHLEDVAAFHTDVFTRAGELARLAAAGVVVHIAETDEQLVACLGARLHGLMTDENIPSADFRERESLSIRMRRAAWQDHSLRSRVRQFCREAMISPSPLPEVSILLATKRPKFLHHALSSVRKQTYPRLELVLVLHGDGFGDVETAVAGLPLPTKVVRIQRSATLGAALNAAVAVSCGTLLTKMDDDDLYDADHIWDLVQAYDFSGADLVGKGPEFTYLTKSKQLVHGPLHDVGLNGTNIAGGTMLISRRRLDEVGGWQDIPRYVDQALINDVMDAGGKFYQSNGAGFVLVRHGEWHTWDVDDEFFLLKDDKLIVEQELELIGANGSTSPLNEPQQNERRLPADGGDTDSYATIANNIHFLIRNNRIHEADFWLDRLNAQSKTHLYRQVTKDLEEALSEQDYLRAERIASTIRREPGTDTEKIISRNYRFLWICNTKVASRSIIRYLLQADPDAELIEKKSISQIYAMYPETRNFYSFAFIRHPYSRAFSFYTEKILKGIKTYDDTIRIFYGLQKEMSFEEVCQWLVTPYGSDAFADRHWLSQHIQLDLGEGRLPDFIGRHESLETDLRTVAERLGLPVDPSVALPNRNTLAEVRARMLFAESSIGLCHLNTLAKNDPTPAELEAIKGWIAPYLNERNRALLRTRYADDFRLCGYPVE